MTDIKPELVERMVALVRDMADYSPIRFTSVTEARAIVAELPASVDPDLLEARRLVAEANLLPYSSETILKGGFDNLRTLQMTLRAIKLGRSLGAGK